ncbi:MAG: enoyl-CoA hydratase/isomerase family protein [Gemmobacter sp.]
MPQDIRIRIDRNAGRVTLTRPKTLNALSYGMARALDDALIAWADDPDVRVVVIDAEGPRAFCAGGDIAEVYAAGRAGNFAFAQRFWAEEYRMNARIGAYPKPVVTLIHGFCMGGGVGVACHASHRIVGESAQIAMPECAIGMVPDVGGSALLARAPGRMGAWLGTTGTRMAPADAIYAGFADQFVPEAEWPALIEALCNSGETDSILSAARPCPQPATLPALQPLADRHFASSDLSLVVASLQSDPGAFSESALSALAKVSPLGAATTLEMLHRLGPVPTLQEALGLEYRVTYRAQQLTDFLEGIRAMVIDKDRQPRWRHADASAVTRAEVEALLAPLGSDELTF